MILGIVIYHFTTLQIDLALIKKLFILTYHISFGTNLRNVFSRRATKLFVNAKYTVWWIVFNLKQFYSTYISLSA